MRKISLVIAMAVILTIGGVFATWTYNSGEVAAPTHGESITIGTATDSGDALGELAIVDNSLTLVVNNKGSLTGADPADNYKTVLTVTGDLTVNFTAATNAPVDMKNGVIVKYALAFTTKAGADASGKYGSLDILTVDTSEVTLTENSTFTISANDIKSKLTLVEHVLDTKTKHGNYSKGLDDIEVVITVTYVGAGV